jgi:hypothetical protein
MTDQWGPRTCVRCGEVFDVDPALKVECPVSNCRAPVGEPCCGANGHAFPGTPPHKEREQLAANSFSYCEGKPR